MEEIVYDLDEIVEFKSSVPLGDYVVRVKSVELGASKEGNPNLEVLFEIQEGDYAAEELFKKYSLKIFTTKSGAKGCMGIADIRNEARIIGEESKLPKKISHSELRKVYASIFGKKKLLLTKSEQVDNKGKLRDDGTPVVYPRLSITGVSGKQHATVGASSDPLADLGL